MILALVAPHTAGDPMSEQRWLNCRLVDIQEQLAQQGKPISKPVISQVLRAHGYRLRSNRKCLARKQHPDRDQQFRYIRDQQSVALAAGQPVISIDTKKKELIGQFKNAGQVWCQEAVAVQSHDFPQDADGRAVPYGIYDVGANRAIIYVGTSGDTPTFAVDNIARWCASEIGTRYPQASQVLILADDGGSNGSRSRVFKVHLQRHIADRFGLTVTVCHFPTGASKWNPIEHRVFSEISKTWAGCPLDSVATVLQYIDATKTQTGLHVQAVLVTETYAPGLRVSNAELGQVNIQQHTTCPTWNYTIYPRTQPAHTREVD